MQTTKTPVGCKGKSSSRIVVYSPTSNRIPWVAQRQFYSCTWRRAFLISDFKRDMPPRNLRCITFFGWTPKTGGHPLVVKEFHVVVFCSTSLWGWLLYNYMILITSLVPTPTGPWFWDYWIARRQIHHEMKVDSQWISHWKRLILHDFAGKCVFTGWNTFRYHNGIKRCFLKCSDMFWFLMTSKICFRIHQQLHIVL